MVVANVGNGKMSLEVSGSVEEITKDFCIMLDKTREALGKKDKDIAKIFELACVSVLIGMSTDTLDELFEKNKEEHAKE